MADPEIVDPERSYEVVLDAGGPWIPPQAWKTPRGLTDGPKLWNRRFPHLLGRTTPAHTIHRPDNSALSDQRTG